MSVADLKARVDPWLAVFVGYNDSSDRLPKFSALNRYQVKSFNFRCTWNGNPCNISQDFRTILTEFGVCYSFNNKNPPRSVRETGSMLH